MKKKLVLGLLIVSLGINLVVLGNWWVTQQWNTPSAEEAIILSEMVQRTVDSEDYQKIAASEEVLAIDRGLDKATGGAFPYYFYVNVRTDQQSYLFYCDGPECSTMDNEGWGYSIYEDEDTRLPFRGN
ncbi:hypothetical protein [Planococcus faecalis]|uniref:hypothetical protein n=1 Tax=Planococcus faecalis TaxID=1598147 RepID=UPI0008D9CF14|nr:hypothetical protein [Planococcus faecalis]OHX51853.1 hypothetical protein BB777_14645 [Planococcus faecalis]